MNQFRLHAARRIAAASLLLAALVSPLAWCMARQRAERNIVALAMEASERLLHHFGCPHAGCATPRP